MITLNNSVTQRFPGAKMGILAITHADPAAALPPSAIDAAMAEIRNRYAQKDRKALKSMYPIQVYTDYYRHFGYSYHVLAQLESVLQGKKQFQSRPSLLNAIFVTEVESMLLASGHDLAALRTPLQLKTAAGDETYLSISGKAVTAVPGDLMVCDGTGVISSILRGPDERSRITAKTTDVLITLYAPPGIQSADLMAALHRLETRIASFSPSAETLCLDVYE